MAGPIRELLERAPLRTAIRNLFNRGPRSQDSKDSLESSMQSDRRGRTNLMEGPRRFGRREVEPIPLVSSAPIANVAPSPAARQAQAATTEDVARRQVLRQGEMAPPPPPAPPEPIAAGVLPQAAATGPPIDTLIGERATLLERSEALREAAKQLESTPNLSPADRLKSKNLTTRADILDDKALGITVQMRADARAVTDGNLAHERAVHLQKIATPDVSIVAEIAKAKEAYLTQGMGAAFAVAYMQAAAAKIAPVPTDPAFANILRNAKADGAATIITNSLVNRIPLTQQNPNTVGILGFIIEQHPGDAAAQEILLNQIMADSAVRSGQTGSAIPAKMGQILLDMLKAQRPKKKGYVYDYSY